MRIHLSKIEYRNLNKYLWPKISLHYGRTKTPKVRIAAGGKYVDFEARFLRDKSMNFAQIWVCASPGYTFYDTEMCTKKARISREKSARLRKIRKIALISQRLNFSAWHRNSLELTLSAQIPKITCKNCVVFDFSVLALVLRKSDFHKISVPSL